MSNWLASDESESILTKYSTFIIFSIAAISALTLFVAFQPMIESITAEAPTIVYIMFVPTFIVGFLYGLLYFVLSIALIPWKQGSIITFPAYN